PPLAAASFPNPSSVVKPARAFRPAPLACSRRRRGAAGCHSRSRQDRMAFLFNKFQEAVRTLAKNPMFARDPRHLQFEADVNRLFLYTSYYRLGENAEEKDAEEIIDLASKASVADQQKQVQDNVHYQLTHMCQAMDTILRPDVT
ncbi:unnamed protein product, partial [Urochloa humidicola]